MRKSPIVDALFPEIRGKILAATLTRPEKRWYLSELSAFLNTQPSSLQREILALSKAGILEQSRDGRRVYIAPDTRSPVFLDLKSLFDKTAGMVPVLAQTLEPFGDRIRLAFLYGSVARSQEESGSDIDLLTVGKIGLSDLVPALRGAERTLGRPINPSVFSDEEFARKMRSGDHFVKTVLDSTIQFVKGSKNELAAIVGEGRSQNPSDQQAGTGWNS
jgi:DNA-binding transcriptional ArsR family regulator